MKPAAAGWLLLVALLATVAFDQMARADVPDDDEDDDDDDDDLGDDYKWKIVFYTGDRTWAGTDSQIYFQVIGDKGVSPIQLIPSSRSNFEVNSIDSFAIRNINLNKVGAVKSLVVGKQHSLAFFNDWQLIKVELYDNTKEHTKKYVFNCNCWLTTTKFKQIIPLEFVGIHQPVQPVTQRGSKLFPLMVGLLLLLLILTMVSYFTNIVCKRWREIQEVNSDRELATSFTESRLRRNRRNNHNAAPAPATTSTRVADPYKDSAAGLDKPPEYFELFPASSTSKITTTAAAGAAADHVTEMTPIVQQATSTTAAAAVTADLTAHVVQIDEPAAAAQSTSIEMAPPVAAAESEGRAPKPSA